MSFAQCCWEFSFRYRIIHWTLFTLTKLSRLGIGHHQRKVWPLKAFYILPFSWWERSGIGQFVRFMWTISIIEWLLKPFKTRYKTCNLIILPNHAIHIFQRLATENGRKDNCYCTIMIKKVSDWRCDWFCKLFRKTISYLRIFPHDFSFVWSCHHHHCGKPGGRWL